ncbi:FhaB [Rhodomicrobium udaipurense JA643]|uniref:DNA/RNA non-specific endonuclease n=1 Tax=Rhodomicrobium udaipurense TaxID=1202716 RepID=A0A8I1GHX8_9HYPH|nr:DNA/RNA non-specific endonuclease [Rhodomicrobium udaipurense]KAI95293.1 FhaB [Rhodomicrobium udaipurense JA643]MBJ7544456.1 DNA/RNA non-specific endonuclease [Rhodomicrobium udaipurense]
MNLGAADSISSVRDTSFVSDALKADSFKAQLEAHPANTPAKQEQPAPKKEEKADAGGDWMTRGLGALQAVGGVLEVVGGVAGAIITSETGVGAVVGGAVALHGIDDIQAGLRTAFSGQSTETFTQAATTDAAKALGASPEVAMGLGIGVDLVAGGIVGGGGKAAVKGAGLIDDAARLANKADDAARLAGNADDAAKAGTKGDDALKLASKGDDAAKAADDVLQEITTKSGTKGNWSAELANPKPNTVYKIDGDKIYHTDDLGRVKDVDVDLSLIKRDRNTKAQSAVGHSGEPGDQGGHLVASSLGGSGDKINLVPQNGNLNTGAWKRMEDRWREALQDGKPVHVKIENVYDGSSIRPESFNITYRIGNDRPVEVTFRNAPGVR